MKSAKGLSRVGGGHDSNCKTQLSLVNASLVNVSICSAYNDDDNVMLKQDLANLLLAYCFQLKSAGTASTEALNMSIVECQLMAVVSGQTTLGRHPMVQTPHGVVPSVSGFHSRSLQL